MHLGTLQTQKSRIGTCPHGLPLGACPICNGMGGGAKKADFSAKPGEMSWNECAAIGAFLKAQRMAKQAKEADFQAQVQNLIRFQNTMAKAVQNASQFALMIQSSMPAIIAKPIVFVVNNIVVNGLNALKNFPTFVSNFVQNLSQKLADITDKLTAIYGELKASIAKKISEPLKDLKKKIKSIFSIFKSTDTDNDDKKIDETKRAFELKTFIHKLYKKLRKDEDD